MPCFLSNRKALELDWCDEQDKTTSTFSEKWRRFSNYGFRLQEQRMFEEWFCEKFGLEKTTEALYNFYKEKNSILEVGTGSGFNLKMMATHSPGYVVGADISDAAYVTHMNTKDLDNVLVMQADLMQLPLKWDQFDFVIADGVLHHTPNTYDAVKHLYQYVKPGGQFFFYIYKKMNPVKQFCDQYVRDSFKDLSAEECLKQCEPITELGRELSKLDAKITLENPIPVLGIPAGTHNVQRLLYYTFFKCFWSDNFDFETNNMINFDWYHPHNAWQHTEEEVHTWMKELGVTEYNLNNANPNGLSVLLRKPD